MFRFRNKKPKKNLTIEIITDNAPDVCHDILKAIEFSSSDGKKYYKNIELDKKEKILLSENYFITIQISGKGYKFGDIHRATLAREILNNPNERTYLDNVITDAFKIKACHVRVDPTLLEKADKFLFTHIELPNYNTFNQQNKPRSVS